MNRPCTRCRHPRPIGGHCQPCHNRQRRERNARTDQLAIDTTIRDHRATPGLRPHERRAIAAKFTKLRLPAAEIARILGVTPRTVRRWRARDRETADAT